MDRLAGTGKEPGVSAHEESTWCCGEHQTSWEAAGAPQDRLWPASRVRTTARTPCRATGAVDRAICCSQVAGALESRVCVGVGGFPSQRVGSNVRGITRLTHAKCHWRHGAASELHLARHQPRAPAPHILCVSRLVPREPRSVEMGSVGKPRAARMPLAPSGWSPRPLSVPRQLGRGASVGFYEQKWGFENYGDVCVPIVCESLLVYGRRGAFY